MYNFVQQKKQLLWLETTIWCDHKVLDFWLNKFISHVQLIWAISETKMITSASQKLIHPANL